MGDRASTCRSSMTPIASFIRPNGEHAIVHRCLGCGVQRHNRIAADDNFELVQALPIFATPEQSDRGRIEEFEPSA